MALKIYGRGFEIVYCTNHFRKITNNSLSFQLYQHTLTPIDMPLLPENLPELLQHPFISLLPTDIVILLWVYLVVVQLSRGDVFPVWGAV